MKLLTQKFKIIFISILILSCDSYAQTLSLNQTVDYINKKLIDNPYDYKDGYGKTMSLDYYSISVSTIGLITVTCKSVKSWNNKTEVCKSEIYKDDVNISFTRAFNEKQNLPTSNRVTIECNCSNDWMKNGESLMSNSCHCVNCYRDDANSTTSVYCLCYGSQIALMFSNKNAIAPSIFNAIQHLMELVITDPSLAYKGDQNDPFSNTNFSNSSKSFNIDNSSNIIKLTKNGDGTFSIPILINGALKIDFILDSGASDVLISPDVALTLIRTGTVSESDFIGTQTYQFANGSKAKSKVFMIHKIEIGNKSIENVKASISNSLSAPMLLGQSVLNRFGKVIIDYQNSTLTIIDK